MAKRKMMEEKMEEMGRGSKFMKKMSKKRGGRKKVGSGRM